MTKFVDKVATLVWAAAFSLGLLVAPAGLSPAMAATGGKVLVILSNTTEFQLKEGKSHHTGFFLDELEIPLRKIVEAGFTPVFADPQGTPVTFDPLSNDKSYFGGDDAARAAAVKFLDDNQALKHPLSFDAVLKQGTAGYVGVFAPGGHAPMQDLMQDPTLGKILLTFHTSARPTGVICHGPTILLSTVSDPVAFRQAMVGGDVAKASQIATGWPYAGYRLTVFATAEEQALEGPGRRLDGYVPFYAVDALAQAGAHVDRMALWHPNVVEDREVISGQQPQSSDAFGDAFVARLKSAKGS